MGRRLSVVGRRLCEPGYFFLDDFAEVRRRTLPWPWRSDRRRCVHSCPARARAEKLPATLPLSPAAPMPAPAAAFARAACEGKGCVGPDSPGAPTVPAAFPLAAAILAASSPLAASRFASASARAASVESFSPPMFA